MSFTAFDEVPRFAFEEETTGAVATRVAWNVAGLALPAAAIAWLGLLGMRRYPIVAS